MMMAFNSDQTPTPALSDSTVATLHSALARYVADGDLGAALHEVLCEAAREARDKGIMAERLLIALKSTWNALPRVRDADDATSRTHLERLQRLITRCIEVYYKG